MTSEIRANIIKNRVGLGTIEYSNTGPIISGVTTALNFKTGTSNLHNTGLNVQDLDVDGHTNLDNVSIAGVTTASGNIVIENAEPSIFFTDTNANPDYKIFNDSGALKVYDTTYNATRLQIGPTNGEVTIASNTYFPNGITMNPGTASVVNTIAQRLNDTDTKIRFPANDTFTVETGGSERLRCDSDGVKTLNGRFYSAGTFAYIESSSTSTSTLTLKKSASGADSIDYLQLRDNSNAVKFKISGDGILFTSDVLASHEGDTDTKIRFPSDNTISFETGGSERLRIDSNGNMGLGTNSLVGNAANVYFTVNGSTLSGIALKANGTTQGYLQGTSGLIRLSSDGSKPITFDTNGSERLRITSDGKFLFNSSTVTASYGGKYHITNTNVAINSFANNQHAQTFMFAKSRGTTGSGGTIVQDNDFCGHLEWYADDGVDTASQIAKISGRINGTPGANDTPGELIFYTTADGANASTERLRIEADGRLVLSNSGGIQLSPVASNLYQINGALSYYAANNAVYLNGAGDNGLLRLNATGQYNDRTSINLFGKDVGGYGDTITFRTVSVERVRINSNGDLMVGTTSDVSDVIAIFGKNHNGKSAISVENTDTNSSARIRYEFKNGSNTSYIEKYNSGGWYFFNGTPSSSNPNVGFYGSNSWISLRLRPGDRSGNDVAHIAAYWGTSNGLMIEQGGPQSGTFKAIRFTTSHYGGERGYIGVTLGGTSYNSSSDYRMKQDVIDLTGAIDRVKSFKPKRFKWKEDPTYTVDGFLAHEASTVVPESVVGEKDAVDSNGDPEYQVMDNSKLVPVLTAALKEAIAKIENLETKVAALESS